MSFPFLTGADLQPCELRKPHRISKNDPHNQKRLGERGHVARISRPSDRARGRLRSGEPRLFWKKNLYLYWNQLAVQGSSHVFFSKKLSNFNDINPQSCSSLLTGPASGPALWVGLPPPSGLLMAKTGSRWVEFGPTLFFYFSMNLLFI